MNFTAIAFINLGLGTLLIFIGFLVSNNPELIAGYNTMDTSSKKKFDIDGFKNLMKKSFILTGFIIIVLTIILSYSSTQIGKLLVSIVPASILPVFLIIKSKDYYKESNPSHYKKESNSTKINTKHIILLVLFFLLIFGGIGFFIFYASKEPEVFVKEDKLIITGLNGVNVPVEHIYSVNLVDTIPNIVLRTNGLGLGCVRKGYFKFENNESPLLFLQTCERPYIQVIYKDDNTIFINFKSERKVKDIYQILNNYISL